ncbi:MAG: hypothetical protein IH613_13295 [Desulfuromonadales bacterium]|nr:hypothetical protein [Desulfuromonadales bacterium]
MSGANFFIGWDVGGWNCDTNPRSRDAIVILDSAQEVLGAPWRGNLRRTINEAKSTRDWLVRLFSLCQVELPDSTRAILAIDTPLGFSQAFIQLVTKLKCETQICQSDSNPYLFRKTEQFLFEHGLAPLSAIKDMIGSQATKGMHVLARFAPKVAQCGVWVDSDLLTIIEAYPSSCKGSALMDDLLRKFLVAECIDPPMKQWVEGLDHPDKVDALICALLAHVFTFQQSELAAPPEAIDVKEGWIWVPRDGLRYDVDRRVLID